MAALVLRRSGRPARSARILYWISATAWVALGLTATTGRCLPLGGVGAWLAPIVGLFLTNLMHWRTQERPALLLEEHPDQSRPGNGSWAASPGASSEATLDLEDRRLLGHLLALLGRRATHLMIPLESVPHIFEDDSVERIAELFRTHGQRCQKIPVLQRARRTSAGLIDARLFLPRIAAAAPDRGEAPRKQVARDYAVELPTIAGWDPATSALDRLRGGGRGAVAVVNARGRVVGYIGWPGIFHLLLGRPVREAHL
jgi:CBS domain containing-hemolysin-like protein